MKNIYIRIGFIAVLLLVIFVGQFILNYNPAALTFYIRHIFLPLQQFRSFITNKIPLSVGDIIYLLLALLFVLILIRTIYYAFTFRKNKRELAVESLRLVTLPLVIYFSFWILWGGNYSRRPLAADWYMPANAWNEASLELLSRELVQHLNRELQAGSVKFHNLKSTNRKADSLYKARFGKRLANMKVKPTGLGYLLNYLGIQGYYNPLSGEAQFNRFIPAFMHPFVVSHEMAHQAGIAAEDDANLLAYIIGVQSGDPAFRYSAYFNLFLYAYGDLKRQDSATAARVYAELNLQSKNDIDSLKAMNRRYRSRFRGASIYLYDEYLRLHGQHEGINTYNDVSQWVYYWEKFSNKKADLVVCP